MLIGELADRTGVNAKALRFYEGRGLLPEPARTSGGYRDYPDSAVDRVAFIKAAQASGFTLTQISEILRVRDRGDPPCAHVQTLVGQRLDEVEHRLAELRRVRNQLRDIADRAAIFSPLDCSGYCELIQPS